MSIADHFEQIPDAGFVRNYDSSSAKRQFIVSLVLIVVIAVAASALGLLLQFGQTSDGHVGVSVAAPTYVGSLER